MTTSQKRTCLLLLLLGMVLYGLYLGFIPLLDPDEPVYGQTAKEMLITGDWLSPRIYGEFWYDKPPLFYWLEAISFSCFGISTWSARLPSVIGAIITSIYLFLSACPLIGEKAARRGAFIFATSLEIIILARSAVTDTTLLLALTVAMMSFARKKYISAYTACGVALLAKGPIGFGFPALIVGLWLLLTKQLNLTNIMKLRWIWGIPLACLIGLPWFIYMSIYHGSTFTDTFLGYHNITRFITPEHEGQNHIWMYFLVLTAGFFPWTGTIPLIFSYVKHWKQNKVLMYFIVWASFIFVFFSLSSTQLFSYILPMYPPLALLSGYAITKLEEKSKVSIYIPTMHFIFILVVAIALALSPILPIGGILTKLLIFISLFILGGISAYTMKKKLFSYFFLTQGIISLFVILSVWILFATSISENFASKNIGDKLSATPYISTNTLYIDSFYRPGIAFYQNIYGKPLPNANAAITVSPHNTQNIYLPISSKEITIPKNSYFLVQKKTYNKYPESEKKNFSILWELDTAYFLIKKGV
ncbi:ArnT family glycosyltransferase [Dialister pneumosintes]|nr:glycosyltransferase family 39 protein [Dialister pneumosintes]